MTVWHVGHSVAGYPPDDGPAVTVATRDEAWDALVEHATWYTDQEDEAFDATPDTEDDGYRMRTVVNSILHEATQLDRTLPTDDLVSWTFEVADHDDRRIVFWIYREDAS